MYLPDPCSLLSTHIVSQIRLNPLVDYLGLPICLRVIVGVGCQLCPHQSKQLPLEYTNKPTVPIIDDVPEQPMEPEDLPEE
jgi:hypothetical protein